MWDPYRAGAHCITIRLLNLLAASQGIALHGHLQKQACLFCITFYFHLESFWPFRAAVYVLSLKAEPQGEGLRLTLVEMFTYQLRNKKEKKRKKKKIDYIE